jgi:hypothetical protein
LVLRFRRIQKGGSLVDPSFFVSIKRGMETKRPAKTECLS